MKAPREGDVSIVEDNKWIKNDPSDEDKAIKEMFGIKGFILPRGNKKFAVQYHLRDFVNGYDQLVFKVTAYSEKKDKKDPTKVKLEPTEQGDIVITITERELFKLE